MLGLWSMGSAPVVTEAADPRVPARTEAGEWLQHATVAIRARGPLELRRDTSQPFPSFSEIHAATLKALQHEIITAGHSVEAV